MKLSDSAQKEMREYARDRLAKMRKTWGMWALTKEAYLMQAWLLLELSGDDMDEVRMWAAKLTDNGMVLGQKLDEAFAHKVCDWALERLEKL